MTRSATERRRPRTPASVGIDAPVRPRPTRARAPKRAEPSTPRGEILSAAAAAIAAHGYHGMSMRDLAKATGRALASFYSHYAAKEDVLFDLQKTAFETLIASVQGALAQPKDPVARLYVFLFNHVRYVAENRPVMHVLVHEAGALPPPRRRVVRALKERYFRIARDIVAALLETGCGRGAGGRSEADEAELERTTYSIFGMLNWTYGWYEPAHHGDPSEVARTIHRIALCGLATRCPHSPVQDAMDRYLVTLNAPPLIGEPAEGKNAR